MAVSITQKIEKPTKFERIYEDDECTSIWKYNLLKNPYGPVEVEYRWKRSFNPWNQKKMTIAELIKQEKREKRLKGL
jgi:hypothetical protein